MKVDQASFPFAPSGFFALRTPLLPFDELLALRSGLEGLSLDEEVAALRSRLAALVARPAVREALFVASPSLAESLPAWEEAPEGERGQKVELALLRYLQRMAGRSTPFGLFAGCSTATLGARTDLVLGPREGYRRHTRLDMDYLCALADALVADPARRAALRFRASSSLYPVAEQLRYVEPRLDPETRERSYFLSAVEPSPELEATLERAAAGRTPTELAAALTEADPLVSLEEAEGFVNACVEARLLLPELQPAVTGAEPLGEMIDRLSAEEALTDVADLLGEARAALASLDEERLGADPGRYLAVARRLEALPTKVELPRLFQVDLVKPAPEATLGAEVVRELGRAVGLLHRMAPAFNGDIERLRDQLVERYQGREVPLVEALDEEHGVGFEQSERPEADPSPLLAGLSFPGDATTRVSWGRREEWLLVALQDAAREGRRELELDDEALAALEASERRPLPDALFVSASLAAPSPEALAGGDFRLVLRAVAGPSGATLLGRFCHGDEQLAAQVREHLRAEEALRPEAIFAEIVHLPEGRIGNVLLRPALRDHEIPFLGRSGLPPERQLPVSDLLVSVEGGRIVLRSRRLGREVVPRLTTAHNYTWRSLGLYRFLCALQRQGAAAGLGWSFAPFDGAPFLPRVRSGRLILARAAWTLRASELKPLGRGSRAERFEAAQVLRRRLGWPRWVALGDSDNELPVDLDNPLSVETFAQLVKGRGAARVVELLPAPGELCCRGPEGLFAHEVVVPFVRRGEPESARPARPAPPPGRRAFLPGSPWLMAKLYTGATLADRVLCELVRPLVDEVAAAGCAERWFFMRYGDPDWHLRLRFSGDPAVLAAAVVPRLEAAAADLHERGLLPRLALDTYEREVERYGGPAGVELAEELFHHDSEAALAMVEATPGDEGLDARWKLALLGVHGLLVGLGLDLEARLALLRRLRAGFGREHRADLKTAEAAFFRKGLSARFRKEAPSLEALLEGRDDDEALAPGLEALARRAEALAPLAARHAEAERRGELTATLPELAESYAHLHVNRLLRSAARAQELVIYDFLSRLYASQAARARR